MTKYICHICDPHPCTLDIGDDNINFDKPNQCPWWGGVSKWEELKNDKPGTI